MTYTAVNSFRLTQLVQAVLCFWFYKTTLCSSHSWFTNDYKGAFRFCNPFRLIIVASWFFTGCVQFGSFSPYPLHMVVVVLIAPSDNIVYQRVGRTEIPNESKREYEFPVEMMLTTSVRIHTVMSPDFFGIPVGSSLKCQPVWGFHLQLPSWKWSSHRFSGWFMHQIIAYRGRSPKVYVRKHFLSTVQRIHKTQLETGYY